MENYRYFNSDEEEEEEEIANFLEVYDTIKDRTEKILELYPIARTRGMGSIATVILYYWHFHPKQLIKLAKAIYTLVKERRRIRVVEDKEKNEKRIIPMKLNDRDLELLLGAVRGLTNPEDILRNKRRIQNDEGKFRPPEEDEERARYKEELIRKAMVKSKFEFDY